MGQAKQRGSYEERRQSALERDHQDWVQALDNGHVRIDGEPVKLEFSGRSAVGHSPSSKFLRAATLLGLSMSMAAMMPPPNRRSTNGKP